MSANLRLVRSVAGVVEAPTLPHVGFLETDTGHIKIEVSESSVTRDLIVTYRGTPDALLCAGAISAQLLSRRSCRGSRVDEWGNHVHVVKRGKQREVLCYLSLASASEYPGIELWMINAVRKLVEEASPDSWKSQRRDLLSTVQVIPRVIDQSLSKLVAGIDNRRVHPDDAEALLNLAARCAAELEHAVAKLRVVPRQGLRLVGTDA
jgi:hypothetical protein